MGIRGTYFLLKFTHSRVLIAFSPLPPKSTKKLSTDIIWVCISHLFEQPCLARISKGTGTDDCFRHIDSGRLCLLFNLSLFSPSPRL